MGCGEPCGLGELWQLINTNHWFGGFLENFGGFFKRHDAQTAEPPKQFETERFEWVEHAKQLVSWVFEKKNELVNWRLPGGFQFFL